MQLLHQLYANLAGANLQGVSLNGANLTNATLTGVSLKGLDLTGTTLVSTKLGDKVDLTGSKLIGANLTGQNLVGANLTGVDASNANFTDANLTEALLAKTNLTRANLVRAVFTGANLITATLTDALWNDTACPRGGKSSTGCSPFATVPGPQYTQYKTWYNYQAPATPVIPSTAMAGTPGAPLIGGPACISCDDGIQGTIENLSDKRILVRTVRYSNDPQRVPNITSDAILEPNSKIKMPYRLFDFGTLEIFLAPEGKPLGDPFKYRISDQGRLPSTAFTPPGWKIPRNIRENWKTETNAEEIWGTIRLWVRRELDGWDVPASEEYVRRYGDPNKDGLGSDYAIFTIEVRGTWPVTAGNL